MSKVLAQLASAIAAGHSDERKEAVANELEAARALCVVIFGPDFESSTNAGIIIATIWAASNTYNTRLGMAGVEDRIGALERDDSRRERVGPFFDNRLGCLTCGCPGGHWPECELATRNVRAAQRAAAEENTRLRMAAEENKP
jgi:hypothetical protein